MTAVHPHGRRLAQRADANSGAAFWVRRICVRSLFHNGWAPGCPDPDMMSTSHARNVVRIPPCIGADFQLGPRRHNLSLSRCIPLSRSSCLTLSRLIGRLIQTAGFPSSQTASGARFAALKIRAPADPGETRNLLRVQVLSKPCRNSSRSVTLNSWPGDSFPGSAIEGSNGWFK